MKRAVKLGGLGIALVGAAMAATGRTPWGPLAALAGEDTRDVPRVAIAQEAHRSPVIVELFTSESCSSCPPADAALTALKRNQPVAGAGVIALEEHVDYWNRLGWIDPFSSPAFSARQSAYAEPLHLDSVYTPQMVVDGKAQFVGSDSGAASQAIAQAAQAPKADVRLTLAAGDALHIQASRLPAAPGPVDVVLAITEDGLRSHATAGENQGVRFVHHSVVRALHRVGAVSEGGYVGQIRLTLAPIWKRDHLEAVVLLQDRKTRAIVGAAALPLGG